MTAKLALIGCFVFYFLFSLVQWVRPPIEDEVPFVMAAIRWATQGPAWEGLWHTPLYLESLSVWQKLFGVAQTGTLDGARVIRSFGTFCGLLTLGIFLWGLVRHEKYKLDLRAALTLSFLALHPYFIQGTLLTDIDNTILLPGILLWIIGIEKWDRQPTGNWRLTVMLGILTAVLLMAKEITPAFLLPLWVGYAWIRKFRIKKSPVHTKQAIAGIGIALVCFFVFLQAWGAWRGFLWTDPFKLTIDKIGEGAARGTLSSFGPLRWAFLNYLPFLWLGVPLLVAGALAIKRPLRLKQLLSLPVGAYFAFFTMLFYFRLGQTSYYFPKYTVCVLVVGLYSAFQLVRLERSGKVTTRIALALFGLMALGFLLDPLAIVDARRMLSVHVFLTHAAALFLPLALLFWLARNSRAAPLGLVAGLLGTSIAQTSMSHSSPYLYGEKGFREVVRFVQTQKNIITPARDISASAGIPLHLPHALPRQSAQVIVGRNYGVDSIGYHPEIEKKIRRRYPCRADRGYFEFYWRAKKCHKNFLKRLADF